MPISEAFSLFVHMVSLVSLGMVRLVNAKVIGERYYRFTTILVLSLALLSLPFRGLPLEGWVTLRLGDTAWELPWWNLALFAGGYPALLLIHWNVYRLDVPSIRIWVFSAVVLSGLTDVLLHTWYDWSAFSGLAAVPWKMAVGAVTQLLSAMVFGVTLMGLFLGHWYLISPGLSFEFYRKSTFVFLGSLVLRILSLVVVAFWLSRVEYLEQVGNLSWFWGQHMWTLILQLLVGLIAPGALGWMILSCIRIRSNTSATGLFYIVVFLMLISEGIAITYTASYGLAI